MILNLKIKPNARKNEIIIDAQENIKIKVNARPVDGKANKELVSFLSEIFDVPKSYIEILSGETSQHKKVRMIGEDEKFNEILRKLKING